MTFYIDCHNHSLPTIDDGAKSIEMSLEMLKCSYNDNVRSIILTPHHLNGAFNNQRDKVIDAFNALTKISQQELPELSLYLGSEVHLVDSTADEIINGDALTYCDKGKAALIELPKHNIPIGADKIFSQLLYNGITPVIAHPERNTTLRSNTSQLSEWIELGCKAQLTAMSCEGKFGSDIQAIADKMITEGLVHIIASDAHRPIGRSPILSNAEKAITEKFGSTISNTLFYENPQKLIEGNELINIDTSQLQKYTQKKKRFLWF